ncbi:hypothetical protein VitviT2T_020821 [Vitis vinifera]|uniref:Uncharacterized protein n=1 Tax=Vitis vinifera TaxID=29760 RepID=A0ABY9D552_VITVI|nr:hypothetical protein VitviT2T_020821 [Vitis vinifera]
MIAFTMSSSHQETSLADHSVLQIGLVVHITTTQRGHRQHGAEDPSKQEHQPDRISALLGIQHQQHILEAKHCSRLFENVENFKELIQRNIPEQFCNPFLLHEASHLTNL